jgi:hypothetical protein
MKKIKLKESDLTRIITKVIKEQYNLSYDEFLEEMLQRGQNLIKLVEVIRKGNPNEMANWDVRTQEKALGEFREVAEFTTDLINEFKPEVTESKKPIKEQHIPRGVWHVDDKKELMRMVEQIKQKVTANNDNSRKLDAKISRLLEVAGENPLHGMD